MNVVDEKICAIGMKSPILRNISQTLIISNSWYSQFWLDYMINKEESKFELNKTIDFSSLLRNVWEFLKASMKRM